MASTVTEVKVYLNTKYQKGESYLGTANITLNEDFVIKGIRILNGKHGAFVAMPSKKGAKGEYTDVCFPITKGARAEIVNAVLAEAKVAKANGGTSPAPAKKEAPAAAEESVEDLPF